MFDRVISVCALVGIWENLLKRFIAFESVHSLSGPEMKGVCMCVYGSTLEGTAEV